MKVGRDFVNRSARLSHDFDLQDDYSPPIKELMEIKQFRGNMLNDIALDVSYLHPCNTSNIISTNNIATGMVRDRRNTLSIHLNTFSFIYKNCHRQVT
jgi:hypothetical protein